jgi:gamma-glutamyl-gamma-aminobutyrate hydrolase PuuD
LTTLQQKPVVALSMRITEAPNYHEPRDALGHEWVRRFDGWDMVPMLIPNALADPTAYLERIQPDLLVLTGGDDIGATPERDKTETTLLAHALKTGLPVLGVCRGLQVINTHFGGDLGRVEGHVGSRHDVAVSAPFADLYGETVEVNSYHGLSVTRDGLADGLMIIATDADGNIEAFCHASKPVAAIMWHPERDALLDADRQLMTQLMANGAFWL